jgi:osmotically-inducible protein OsmY
MRRGKGLFIMGTEILRKGTGIVLSCLLVGYGMASAAGGKEKSATTTKSKTAATATAPDNSAKNADVIRSDRETADQQSNAPSDVELAAKVRSALTNQDSLSTYAKNLKVITNKGMVTIRGPVRSQAEREEVERIVGGLAERNRMTVDITIAEEEK